MDIPSRKIVKLLGEDSPAEVRAAAATVLAELGAKDPELAGELLGCLDADDGDVRLAAIKAAGKLKISKALPTLLERIKRGGAEAGASAEAAANLGAEGVKGLQAMMHAVVPGVRRYIAAALSGASSAGAEAGVNVILDRDPAIATAAANAIIARIPNMAAAQKKELAASLLTLAKGKKNPASAEMPLVRILASLNDPATADALWDRTQAPHSLDVRSAALSAVGGWVSKPTPDQWRKLFALASESNFQILAPALAILGRLPYSEKQAADWLKVVAAPDPAARRLAMEKIGDRDDDAYAALLMEQLRHVDQGLRDAARLRLTKLESGRKALVKALATVENADELWQLARLVGPFAKGFTPKVRSEVLAKALKYVAADDHRADALLFTLKEGDAGKLRDELLEVAVAKRKKKDHEGAIRTLKLAARDPAVGGPVRLELAMNGLKVSAKDVAAESRAMDPALRQFSNVLEVDAAGAQAEVLKAKWLDAEDLFYLGFHFAERNGSEKIFGAAVLQQMVKAWPKSKLTAAAKNKLKTLVLK